jgi:hypothetical protein
MNARKTIRTLEKLAARTIRVLAAMSRDLHDREDGGRALRRLVREVERLDEALDAVATERALDYLRPGPDGVARKIGKSRAHRYALTLEALCGRAYDDLAALEQLFQSGEPIDEILYRVQLARHHARERLKAARSGRPARKRALAPAPAPAGPPALPAPPPERSEGDAA